jgi:hypothetical protein
MATNPANYLGQPILAADANDYLFTNAVIKDRIRNYLEDAINAHQNQINRRSTNIPADSQRAEKALNLCDDDNNAYIFSKDDFLRFFEGDPDPAEPHQNLQFTHCLLIVGSLTRPGGPRKIGEQTIVIAGCTKQADGTFITQANGQVLKNVATEHPPRSYQAKIIDPVTPTFKIIELPA